MENTKNEKELLACFARNLVKFRTLRGMTREELGFKIGYESDDRMIRWFERGEKLPTTEKFILICKALNVNPITMFQTA